MKQFLIIMMISFITFSVNAQQKGDFLVGVGTGLDETNLSDLNLQPNIQYGLTDNIFIGGSVEGRQDTFNLGLDLRGYVWNLGRVRTFGQAEYNINDSDNFMSLGVGITGFLNNWLFVEPTFQYNFRESGDYGLRINVGVRL